MRRLNRRLNRTDYQRFCDEMRQGPIGNSEIVGRKPVIGGFFMLKNQRRSARKAAWNKRAIAMLKRVGLN